MNGDAEQRSVLELLDEYEAAHQELAERTRAGAAAQDQAIAQLLALARGEGIALTPPTHQGTP